MKTTIEHCSREKHAALKEDDLLWRGLKLCGYLPDEDDQGDPAVLELRQCHCGSTLGKRLLVIE